mmetsp:Transcript_97686/g.174021  ORF Transcript_97686/g.174021 Transcript_97686/m.174021 type:complete len:381 (-) Transcript_97686:69-1211(-)|eukprot:CAMPEP_0197653386 /NCGR_PEP_ID=MMETSP1338-20131121/35323_1 /TAXON_ID=43686 ORGANISM="Pelagodinium beii, Strain RCC1491" /NCGR_SAMPLE_ID=MMETSP1338 /ASSEMBLY_ACC=CAM_ASM_000754 /LENGTH=380 /DNA_ID=CAMNT_0043228481 /DNA_START=72 /DNA_END=1214 /DNA_ORIENTATION=-
MIDYEAGTWGLSFILTLHGSVIPKAFAWALPNAIIAFFLCKYANTTGEWRFALYMDGVTAVWGSFAFILGFLLVFRNNQAHIRFWEGATSINKVQHHWISAAGSITAFCSKDPAKKTEVRNFQHLCMRLLSMLFACALQRMCDMEDDNMEVLDPTGLEPTKMQFLQECNADQRCGVLLQWLNRLLIDGERNGVLKVPPPIIMRCYQELTGGHRDMHMVKTISDLPFPFPYGQIITCMMLVHWCMTPLLASQSFTSEYWCFTIVLLSVGSLWSLIYIPMQLDNPFGDDVNDLPLKQMQSDFNTTLMQMLHPKAQSCPAFRCPPEDQPTEMVTSWVSHKLTDTSLAAYDAAENCRSASPLASPLSESRAVPSEALGVQAKAG